MKCPLGRAWLLTQELAATMVANIRLTQDYTSKTAGVWT